MIIRTEGEDTGSGAGHPQRPPTGSHHTFGPPPVPMAGPPGAMPGYHTPGVVDEKQQMWKNEKASSGIHAV